MPFAPAASAAATSITATPTQTAYQEGQNAVVNVTTTGSPTNLEWTVISGPDAVGTTAYPNGHDCAPANASPSVCTIPNTHGSGTDLIGIFDGTGSNSAFVGGEQATELTVTFAAAPFRVTLSPQLSSIAASGCALYTVTAADQAGLPAPGAVITVQVTEPTGLLSFGNPLGTCTSNVHPISSSSGLLSSSATERFAVTTGTSGDTAGKVTFGVTSSAAGTASVVAYSNGGADAAPTTSDPSSQTASLAIGTGGPSSVAQLAVTPANVTQYVGTSVAYTVVATDANHNAIAGAEVDYVSTGPDPQSASPSPKACGTTDSSGVATCVLTNGGVAGTDTITFYVNVQGGTPGPDSGEGQQTVLATFQPLPNNGNFDIVTVCNSQFVDLPGQRQNCIVPIDGNSVVFTAAVVSSTNGAPLSGVRVDFANSVTAGPSPTDITPATATCTTGADGTCTETVTEVRPLNNEIIGAAASVGGRPGATPGTRSATATLQTRTAWTFTLTPQIQTVSNGGAPGFTGAVTDQFGAGVGGQTLAYTVVGRNSGKSGTVTTASDGKAVISYADSAVNPASETDTVTVTDVTNNPQLPRSGVSSTASASVQWINGSTIASRVILDVSGTCNTTNPSGTNAVGANAVGLTVTKVCALVENSDGTPLLGKSVTFSVDSGFVSASNSYSANNGKTVTVSTGTTGVAAAFVSSNVIGTQSVVARSDNTTATGTVSYVTSGALVRNIVISPATVQVAPGGQQKFTVTVLDQFGNPVGGVPVSVVQSGPGTLGGVSSASLQTASNGQAAVVLTTAATDTGVGSVVATIPNGSSFSECADPAGTPTGASFAGNCVATATYAVGGTPTQGTTLLLFPQRGVTAGESESVEAVVVDSSGQPVSAATVRFRVTGANAASGSSVTAANGAALFTYSANDNGTDTIAAYVDVNVDGSQQATEPAAVTTVRIQSPGNPPPVHHGKEHPTLTVSSHRVSKHNGEVQLRVVSHPHLSNAVVTFYRIRHGERHTLGKTTTGGNGVAVAHLRAPIGTHLTFQVKVGSRGGVRAGYSNRASLTVR
ncbi:MAG TPA: Ig-like domain-containing protein [Mycobacteriales bacterium]|nr:Ig-like domain-containing protein [Mycobacteriales bacterium]